MSEIPLLVKIPYTAFVCLLVPVYWRQYGWANFLWFSDIALFVGGVALWLQSPLLASMQAVSIVLLESMWVIDFFARLVSGSHLLGLTRYMFNPNIPIAIRGLSLFHLWLPPLLVWMVYRLGYDPWAWLAQSALAWVVILICYHFTNPTQNVNWVFGPGGKPQHAVPRSVYLVLLMLFFPLCVYLPSHLLFSVILPPRP